VTNCVVLEFNEVKTGLQVRLGLFPELYLSNVTVLPDI